MTSAAFEMECDLLAGLRAGEDAAAEHLVRTHTPRLLGLACRFLRNEDDAADAVQDAFVAAFRSVDRFEGNATLGTWLHRIVVNTCLMKLRSRTRRKTVSIDDLLPRFDDTGHHVQPITPWNESAYHQLASVETRAQVRACIDQLPDDFRTILILRDIEELDTDQTAAILGIKPGAVKTRLHRARQALRTLLVPYMECDSKHG